MARKAEKWSLVVQQGRIDLRRPLSRVRADDIKRISGEEPRLMASMHEEQSLPTVFREYGVFLLPISTEEYVIVHGHGFHELENPGPPTRVEGRFPFKMAMIGYGSGENRFLLQAFHSGLLKRFTGAPLLCDAAGGKMRTDDFDFRVDGSPTISVHGAQMEVDKVYESPDDILLFEAKPSWRSNFLIRQLYYPYRVARGLTSKNVRAFFMIANQKEETYNLWEYAWKDPFDYEQIELIRKGCYIIEEMTPPIETFASIEPERGLGIVPQANDLQKVADFPRLVQRGVDTAKKWSEFYGIAVRQASYYRQAAEAFGLVQSARGVYALTEDGRRFVEMDAQRGSDYLAERLLRIPLLNAVFQMILRSGDAGVGKGEIARLIVDSSKLTGTTPPRRADTVFSYFRWMAMTTGGVIVTGGRIYGRTVALDDFA